MENRYLATKEGYTNTCRAIGVISLPIHLLTGYCILFKTSKEMRPVRNSLINLWFWCSLSQIMVSFFFTPFYYLPYMAGFSAGFGTNLNIPTIIQLYIIFAIDAANMMAVVILFENRSSLIFKNKFRISKTRNRVCWIASNFLVSISCLTPLTFIIPEQSEAKLDILKTFPCPTKEFFATSTTVFTIDPYWETFIANSFKITRLMSGLQVIFFSSCCIYYLCILKTTMSPQTRQYQIRSLIGLIIQSFIPILLVVIPLTIFLSQQKHEAYDQLRNNITGISFVAYSGVASLSILLVHQPYRTYFSTIFKTRNTEYLDI